MRALVDISVFRLANCWHSCYACRGKISIKLIWALQARVVQEDAENYRPLCVYRHHCCVYWEKNSCFFVNPNFNEPLCLEAVLQRTPLTCRICVTATEILRHGIKTRFESSLPFEVGIMCNKYNFDIYFSAKNEKGSVFLRISTHFLWMAKRNFVDSNFKNVLWELIRYFQRFEKVVFSHWLKTDFNILSIQSRKDLNTRGRYIKLLS